MLNHLKITIMKMTIVSTNRLIAAMMMMAMAGIQAESSRFSYQDDGAGRAYQRCEGYQVQSTHS